MGVVYRAQQSEPVRREVALKILKLGLDSRQVVERFERERQALAVMEHPSIAQVYDAGISETGRPYFVMELVRGVRLNQFCDERSLGTRERIRLFIQICGAVQHAHQKGVIHRDLKPSNVLVVDSDGTPLPKVIDFGIAKATEEGLTEQRFMTRTDLPMGTPVYMSPEQTGLDGLDVDTRTDIYSLGVILYQLLVGDLPFDPGSYRGWGAFGAMPLREPPSPSYRVRQLDEGTETPQAAEDPHRRSATALRRELKGDLDCIVMKAMEKERDRRYQTASDLAMELQRYLDNQPVLARGPSRRYWVKKFVRRHRVAVGLGSTFGVLVVGFTISLAQARDVADLRRVQAEGVLDFMLSDLRDQLEPVGRLDILNDVGERTVDYFASIPESEFSEEELVNRSRAFYQTGDVRIQEGNLELAGQAFNESLRLARELSGRDPNNLDWLFNLGQSHFGVGDVFLARGELDAAQEQFEAYRDVSERLVSEHPENLDYQLELGYSYGNIGVVFEARGDFEGAAEQLDRSLEVNQTLVDRDPEDPARQLDLALGHSWVGVARGQLGQLQQALAHLSSGVSIIDSLTQREPSNMVWRSELVRSRAALGLAFAALGQSNRAMIQSRDALLLARTLVVHDPENALWRREAAVGEARVAGLLLETGVFGEATDLLTSAQQALARLAAENPTEMGLSQDLAGARAFLAQAHLESGDLRRALEVSQSGLEELARESPLPLDRATAHRLAQLRLVEAETLERLGEGDRGRAALEEAERLLEPLAGESKDWFYLDEWARVLVLLGKRDAGERVVDELISYGYGRPSFIAFLDRHDIRPESPGGTL